MKHFSLIHILLFLLLILMHQCVSAQDYVLTTRGDSLTGDVKPLVYGSDKKVQVVSADKKKTTFSLFEIRAFSIDGEIYHPLKGENGYVFMKLVQPGYLSLYAFQQDNQMRFDGLLLKKMDGENLVVPNLGFKRYVGKFLEDCPAIAERIKEGELGKKNLSELISQYNACIENRTVDHEKVIARSEEQTTKIGAWDSLEEKIKSKEFNEKTNALEMIAEIRKKIRSQEKIPNFLLEGLKNSLRDTGLEQDLEKAVGEVNN